MISPDRAQRVTDSDAGPNASLMARPITGFKAKQAGNKGEEEQVHGAAHIADCNAETPSLFAIHCENRPEGFDRPQP